MQTAGERIGTAGTFVEFTAGMQTSENDFNNWNLLFRMNTDRNAASVIFYGNRSVSVFGQDDSVGEIR